MRQIFHGHGVVEGEFTALAHFFGGTSELKWLHMKSKNNVGTQAGDGLGYVVIQPAHHGRNSDHNRNANHDSKHGERGAQLIAADGIQRHPDYFAVIAFAHHGKIE